MKQSISLVNVILLTLFIFSYTSCKKIDEVLDFGGTAEVMAYIDGDHFETEISFVILEDSTLNMGNILTEKAFLQFHQVYKTGSFPLNTSQGLIEQIVLITPDGKQLAIAEGTYTIDALDNRKASGTFEGMAYEVTDLNRINSYEITKGSYDANF